MKDALQFAREWLLAPTLGVAAAVATRLWLAPPLRPLWREYAVGLALFGVGFGLQASWTAEMRRPWWRWIAAALIGAALYGALAPALRH